MNPRQTESAREATVVRELAEEIWLLKFNRDGRTFKFKFHQALQGPELEAIRQELEASGKSWRLPSGAYILVYAHQYQHAMASLNGRALYPSNVVVSATWLPLLEEIVTAGVEHREILAAPTPPTHRLGVFLLPTAGGRKKKDSEPVLPTIAENGNRALPK